eukprot:m51a1_g9857 putative vesicle transport v-snare 13-like (237) ;mRNA; r:1984601-1985311
MQQANFERYEEDLRRLAEGVRRQTAEAAGAAGERMRAASTEGERLLEEAAEVVRKMEALARESPAQGALLRRRAAEGRSLVEALRRQLLTAGSAPGAAQLGAGAGLEAAEREQRGRLLEGYERNARANERLGGAVRTAYETERVGEQVLADLHGQGEQLRGISGAVSGVNDGITVARGVLGRMGRRIATNKLILALIIAVQLTTIFLMVFFKWVYPHIPRGGGGGGGNRPHSDYYD